MASKLDMSQVLNERLKCETCGNGLKVGKYRWYDHRNLDHRRRHQEKSHYMCQDCKEVENRKRCHCGQLISKEHCPTTEELLKLESMRFKCNNIVRGCQEILGEKSMISHEIECIYRLVPCPDSECDSDVPFNELLEHMEDEWFRSYEMAKGEKIVDIDYLANENLETKDCVSTPRKIVFDKRVFFFSFVQSCELQTLYYWIQLIGSPDEAKNYCYTLELNGLKPHNYIIYSGEVDSVNKSRRDIVCGRKCLGIQFHIIERQFMDENREYKISIGIKNMKEEALDDNEESGISDNDD